VQEEEDYNLQDESTRNRADLRVDRQKYYDGIAEMNKK